MFTQNIGQEHLALISKIPNLKERAEFLSTEDFDVFIKNIASFFTNKLSLISASFLSNAERNDTKLKNDYNVFIKEIIAMKKDIVSINENVSFIDIEKISIPIMLGMKTDLLKTATALKQATALISTELPKVMDACDVYISKVISDENTRTSTRPVIHGATSPYKVHYELTRILDTIIDPHSLKDKKTIKELIPNLSSLEKIRALLIESAEDATLDKLDKLTVSAKRIAEKTDSFYEVITTTDIIISRPVINELSYALEETANIVTTAVTFWHILNQNAAILKMVIERINEFKK